MPDAQMRCARAGMLWQWDLASALGWAQEGAANRAGCWRRFRSVIDATPDEWSYPIALGATPYYDEPQCVHTFPECSNGAFVTTGVPPQHRYVQGDTLHGLPLDDQSLLCWESQWRQAWDAYDRGVEDTASDSILLLGLSGAGGR
jgi:hypothetical protein